MLDMKVPVVKSQTLPIQTEYDIVNVRKLVREWAVQAQFSLVNQTKLMTAASELARNIYKYAGTGTMEMNLLNDGKRSGIQLIFIDQGPGIANIELAMTDGFTTGGSLGMGLSGSKRLVNEFDIHSEPGHGTQVAIVLWR
jgi:serine/threonine-protein kinase RsbT